MAFLLSTFFNRSRIALRIIFSFFFSSELVKSNIKNIKKKKIKIVLVFCLVLAGVVLNVAINYLFDVIRSIGYIVYPPFAYYRAIALMNDRSYDPDKLVFLSFFILFLFFLFFFLFFLEEY